METARKAVLFDLLTALLDSWTVWNRVAGTEAAGRAWRAEYLRLTYSSGVYVPYEKLVRDAARNTQLSPDYAELLEDQWATLPVWSGATQALNQLAGKFKLAVVTNCSERLGNIAAERLDIKWDAVITAERAGFYKPDPRTYQLALETMGVSASEALFVAGSGYDLIGTAKVGLPTYWHNRVGLQRPAGAPPAAMESPSLDGLHQWVNQYKVTP